jgi:hypothetical protein
LINLTDQAKKPVKEEESGLDENRYLNSKLKRSTTGKYKLLIKLCKIKKLFL